MHTLADSVAADRAARRRLLEELDTTFFVEAGAGTGKTTVLVARIVALVAAGRLRAERLVAVTFTEAAAAELRDRIRQELERAARDDARESAARDRCARAAGAIDLAAIGTVHGFAARLLRSFPLEAGLPPGFAVLDDTEAAFACAERFRAWLYEEVTADLGSALAEAVRRATALGLSPDRLSEIAAGFQEHYDLLTADTVWPAPTPPDALAAAHASGPRLLALADLVPLAHVGAEDPLARQVLGVQEAARALAAATDEAGALTAFRLIEARPPKQVGRQADWDPDPCGGEHPARRIRAAFGEVRGATDQVLAGHRAAALAAVLTHLRDLTLASVAERRYQGVATFADLLVWTRDLLRDHPSVRRRAQRLFDRICLDEFQDTDPLQAEIAWYLASDPEQAEERDWTRLRLVPGRLFVVGDPKQSIYRFRRADLGVYERVAAALDDPAGRVALVQSYRCASPVLAWVNHHVGAEMRPDPGVQAAYLPLLPRPSAPGGTTPQLPHGDADGGGDAGGAEEPASTASAPGWGVHRVGGPFPGPAAARAREEAEAIARLARQVGDGSWVVLERRDGGEQARQARYRDVCVLMPGRTALRALERAFERHGIPYRMESGSLVLRTQEVRELLAALRAIDDPSDQVALVAALRSPAYGCSDAELLTWVETGGRLDYHEPGAGPPGRVADALRSLRAFHHGRLGRSPAETIEAVIRERLLAAGTFGQARQREAWRRLRYVVTRARTLTSAGHVSLRAVLDRLEALATARFYDAESPTPEADEDAVRLMTIHGAKGLEFPVVVLSGLGTALRRSAAGRAQVVPDHRAGRLEVGCGAFQTAGFGAARDEAAERAERLRLLYVAATRARDHLVLCLHHGRDDCHAARILEGLDGHTYLCAALALADGTAAATQAGIGTSLDDGTEADPDSDGACAVEPEAAWVVERARRVARLAFVRQQSPSGLARRPARRAAGPGSQGAPAGEEDPADRTGEVGDVAEPVGTIEPEPGAAVVDPAEGMQVGAAVHAVLATVDLSHPTELDAIAEAAARRRRVGHRLAEVRQWARTLVQSRPVREAAGARRVWREVPVAARIGTTLLEGRIDLLFEQADGRLAVVDFKVGEAEAGSADATLVPAVQRLQVGAYALLVQRATQREVGQIALVWAESGAVVTYAGPALADLVAAAADRVLERPLAMVGDGPQAAPADASASPAEALATGEHGACEPEGAETPVWSPKRGQPEAAATPIVDVGWRSPGAAASSMESTISARSRP